MTGRETEGSTGEQCRRENSPHRACSHAEGGRGQAKGKHAEDSKEHRLVLQNSQESGVAVSPDLRLDQRENTHCEATPQQCEGQTLRCSGEMKKLLIGRANCTQNNSQRENPKQIVGNQQ